MKAPVNRAEAEAVAAKETKRITADDIRGSRTIADGVHLDGKEWFADRLSVDGFPRLQVQDKFWRPKYGRKSERTYWVDGVAEFATLEEAAEALNTPAVLTEAQAAFLATLPPTWAPVATYKGTDRFMLRDLADRGYIAFERHGDVRGFIVQP